MNKSDIISWLDQMKVKNYTINDDLTVDVDGNVWLYDKKLIKIPIQFNKVNGDFGCANNKLKSLKGCPIEVNGDFYCDYNNLTSLEGCPKIVNEDFYCHRNQLKSLKYLPDIIKGDLYCDDNLKDTVEYKAYRLLKALRK